MKENNDLTFHDYEFEVAAILLELHNLIFKSESSSGFFFNWGAKKKRSYLRDISSSLPSPPPSVVDVAAAAVVPTRETEKPKALSPATPLLFSPSESDEKSKHNSRRKVSFKRKRGEYSKIKDELTERNNIFKEEIKNLKRYYDQQKALNLKLKTMKERMILGLQVEQSQPKLSLNHPVEVAHQDRLQQTPYTVHRQPFIMGQTAHNSESSHYLYGQNLSFLTSNGGLFMINNNDNAGSSVISDLNVSSSEESFMIMESGQAAFNSGIADKNESRALAAQARQRRIQICRSKNPTAGSKLRYPVCR